jgi:uncharacterized membrane-anchored protein YhcB (DUF1043 family)
MDTYDGITTFVGLVVSILFAWWVSRHYYRKTQFDIKKEVSSVRDDLKKQESSLESLGENTFRAIRTLNPENIGELFKSLTGKWAQKWHRMIEEPPLPVSDNISAEYIPHSKKELEPGS